MTTTKPLRASPSYKIADCELSNSYLLTRVLSFGPSQYMIFLSFQDLKKSSEFNLHIKFFRVIVFFTPIE